MMKSFNTTAVCIPSKHYMVDLTKRVNDIKKYVDWANTKEYNKLSKTFGFKMAVFSTAISYDRINNIKKDVR